MLITAPVILFSLTVTLTNLYKSFPELFLFADTANDPFPSERPLITILSPFIVTSVCSPPETASVANVSHSAPVGLAIPVTSLVSPFHTSTSETLKEIDFRGTATETVVDLETFPISAVMFAVPLALAVTTPFVSTVATSVLSEDQVKSFSS